MIDTPTTERHVIKTAGGDIVYADYARDLERMLNAISNAYGCLPAGKKKATSGVQLAVNRWLNVRREPQHGPKA